MSPDLPAAADVQPRQQQRQPCKHLFTCLLLGIQVLFEMKYNGQDADVWSCGVSLYVMLTGVFPFSRPTDEVNYDDNCCATPAAIATAATGTSNIALVLRAYRNQPLSNPSPLCNRRRQRARAAARG